MSTDIEKVIRDLEKRITDIEVNSLEGNSEDIYEKLNKLTVLKDYLYWYFETNSKHNIKNFANIKTFNVFFITEYKKYVEKNDYFEGNGDIKTSF